MEFVRNGQKTTYSFNTEQMSLLIRAHYKKLKRDVSISFNYNKQYGSDNLFSCKVTENIVDPVTGKKTKSNFTLSLDDIRHIVKKELNVDNATLLDIVSDALVTEHFNKKTKKPCRKIVNRTFTITELGKGKTYKRVKKLQGKKKNSEN